MSKKYVYGQSDIIYTDAFAPYKYETADNLRNYKRKRRKSEKADKYAQIHKLIEDKNIMDYHYLVRHITSDAPELLDALYEKWNMFKGYIDSRRYASSHGYDGISYDDALKVIDGLHAEIDKLNKMNHALVQYNHDLDDDRKEAIANYKDILQYISELATCCTGENHPAEFWLKYKPGEWMNPQQWAITKKIK